MDQQKIGEFLKELRKEKGLTQEQLADKLFVSRRTVSRWETGSNMPDLDMLVELADLYEVDLREIFNGQRRAQEMDKELKETVMQVAEYSTDEKARMLKRFHILFITALVFLTLALVAFFVDIWPEPVSDMINGLIMGVGYGMVIIGVIMTSKYAKQIRDFKLRLLGKKAE
ncbi:MAG: helix-turn-helix domain-containing protein [Ruminococcus sp.]|nr:helix-turn-helix domain-containing protein [Ruminococcus sp.]